jgi:hypothetical protein
MHLITLIINNNFRQLQCLLPYIQPVVSMRICLFTLGNGLDQPGCTNRLYNANGSSESRSQVLSTDRLAFLFHAAIHGNYM